MYLLAATETAGFSFADVFTSNVSGLQVLVTMVMALVIGLFIFIVYKNTFAGVMYSRNFNISHYFNFTAIIHSYVSLQILKIKKISRTNLILNVA